jgi:predicted RNase H-like HicB family nuclease
MTTDSIRVRHFDTVKQDDGRWITTCREYPAVWGGGDTPRDAYEECRAALDWFLEVTAGDAA